MNQFSGKVSCGDLLWWSIQVGLGPNEHCIGWADGHVLGRLVLLLHEGLYKRLKIKFQSDIQAHFKGYLPNYFKLKSLNKINGRAPTSHLWSRTHILVEELVLPVLPDWDHQLQKKLRVPSCSEMEAGYSTKHTQQSLRRQYLKQSVLQMKKVFWATSGEVWADNQPAIFVVCPCAIWKKSIRLDYRQEIIYHSRSCLDHFACK